jgi:dolichyl-phosphate beta-glucosyltransferase
MLLSLIVPAWQQQDGIPGLADGVRQVRRSLPYPVEVVVVDDGSTDRTAELAEAAGFRVIRQAHRGRGSAARAGMLAATGQYRMLVDPAWGMPPAQVLTLLPPALTGFDVAIGSRFAPGAQRSGGSWLRQAAARAYNRSVQELLLPGIDDTQCAFKCFRAEAARSLFGRTRENGSAVDVEVLCLAREAGLSVVEVPVDWTWHRGGRLHTLQDGPGMFAALLRVRARLASGSYDLAPPDLDLPLPSRSPTLEA